MSDRVFLDTNVFVYDVDETAPALKQQRARKLIQSALTGRGVVSYQVVQEFLNVTLKKPAKPMSAATAELYVERVFRPLLLVHSSVELFHEALRIRTRFQISWYDSLVVAAAREAGCSTLYSEDLQHGAKIGGVEIHNPFRSN